MYLLRLIKFSVYILGGLTGLVLLAISYVIQLPIPTSPDIKDLHTTAGIILAAKILRKFWEGSVKDLFSSGSKKETKGSHGPP